MTREQIEALDITGVENRMAEIGKLLDSDDADLDALTEEVEALEARKKALQEAAQKRTALRSQVAAGSGVVKQDKTPKEGRSAVAERLVKENRMTLPMFRENRSVLVSSGKLDVSKLASHVFHGWEHIPEALQLMKDKPADLIKPVVILDNQP